jgi:hypothetical protein
MICHPNGVRSHTDKFSNTTGLTFFMNNAEGEFIYDGAYMHHNIARFDTVLFDDHIQHSFENQREKEKAVLPFFMLTNDNQRKESNRPYIIEGFSLHDIRVETDREYKLDRNGVPYMLQYDRIGRHKRVKLEA